MVLMREKEGCWWEEVLPIQEQRKRKEKEEQRKKNKGYTFWCSKEDKGEEFGWGTYLLGEEMG